MKLRSSPPRANYTTASDQVLKNTSCAAMNPVNNVIQTAVCNAIAWPDLFGFVVRSWSYITQHAMANKTTRSKENQHAIRTSRNTPTHIGTQRNAPQYDLNVSATQLTCVEMVWSKNQKCAYLLSPFLAPLTILIFHIGQNILRAI